MQYINTLERDVNDFRAENPDMGLPQNIFHLVSRLTPIVNVDLLVRDSSGRVLLGWRDDEFAGSGWHVLGGIVRFKETLEQRLVKVGRLEIGCDIEYNPIPVCFKEVFPDHLTRGHFVSFLYECTLPDGFSIDSQRLNKDEVGYLKWHDGCPEDIVKVQEMYRKYLDD